jgi:VCBS repeat-containing protein
MFDFIEHLLRGWNAQRSNRSAARKHEVSVRRPLLEELEKRDLPSLTPLAAAETLFRSAAPGAQIRLRDDGDAVLVPRSTASGGVNHRPGALRLDFVGANSDVRAVGLQRGDGVSDFIALNSRAYDKVVYRNVYDGIDVLYRQTPENHFEFVFLIRPAGDPADIKIAYRGAKRVSLDDAGHLDIRLANTRLVEKAPFAYQRGDIGAHAVGILPRLDNQGRLGFRVGDYDPSNLLVIDPETNFPPEAIDESYGTTHDQALIVDAASGVLSNDWDNESDPLSAVLVSGPSHGTLTLYASGAFDYEPDEAYAGGDSFTYKAFDGTSFSGTATVSIDVINNVPIAINDSYDVTHDQVLTADAMSGVAGNDWDGDGDQMIVSLVSDVSHGDLSLNSDGSFVYEPAAAYAGTDSFTYKLFDGVAYSDVGTATIQVINNLPSALTDSYETLHDEPLTVDVFSGVLGNDWDGDGDQMFVSVVTGPSHGDLMLNADGSFEYEPDEHYVGGDSFTYKAYDGVGYSDPATVTIQMTNSAPEVFLDGPIDGLPGEPVTLSGWFTDSDNPVYDGPYTLKVNWGDGTAVQQFSFATPGSFQYEHTYAAAGLYTVSVDVIDVVGAFAQAQVPARVTVVQSVAWVALDSPLDANPGNGIAAQLSVRESFRTG